MSAASVQGLALRVIKLDAGGAPLDPFVSIVTRSFVSASFSPEYEDGEEIVQKAADGSICVQYKAADAFKNVNLDLSICEPDPDLYAALAGGTKVGTAGWASPEAGDTPPDPVSIEIWSRAIVDGKPDVINPYFHWVFPLAYMRLSGDRTLENGLLANGFAGYSVGNASLNSVLDGTSTDLTEALWAAGTTASAFQYDQVAAIPSTFGVTP